MLQASLFYYYDTVTRWAEVSDREENALLKHSRNASHFRDTPRVIAPRANVISTGYSAEHTQATCQTWLPFIGLLSASYISLIILLRRWPATSREYYAFNWAYRVAKTHAYYLSFGKMHYCGDITIDRLLRCFADFAIVAFTCLFHFQIMLSRRIIYAWLLDTAAISLRLFIIAMIAGKIT